MALLVSGHRIRLSPATASSPLPSGARTGGSIAGRSIAIGSFDGLHLGHQALLSACTLAASDKGLVPSLLSFHPHPRGFFQPEKAPARLLPLRDKCLELGALGILEAEILRFNRALASTTAPDFVSDILVRDLACGHVVVGEDFRFGARRQGDVALLQQMGRELGFGVSAIGPVCSGGERISSSRLREAISAGDLQTAEALLGRPYRLSGRVQHGQKLGRTLGFPTLNIAMPHDLAARGIFAVTVTGLPHDGGNALPVEASGRKDDGTTGLSLTGVASLGRRPTVENQGRLVLEVFVFDWSGNAYGRQVRVTLRQFLRPELHFDSIAAMTHQMHDDLARARAFFAHASV
ncbi:MAG: bifunctional riboflavin kinase/FAD synthetase [Burkholderiaceae bacterium]